MKPIDEENGHKSLGGLPARPPAARPDETTVFDAVYTLLGDMAATISQPREFNFGGAKRRNGS